MSHQQSQMASDGSQITTGTGTTVRVSASLYSPGAYPEGVKLISSLIVPVKADRLDPSQLDQSLDQMWVGIKQQLHQQLQQQISVGQQQVQQAQQGFQAQRTQQAQQQFTGQR